MAIGHRGKAGNPSFPTVPIITEIARRNFDAMVSTASKNTEAMLKLVNEAFAPMSNRMSLAAEKVGKAA